MDALIGSTLGPYRVLEQIGIGGMATVYKAYHPATNRHVAIKALPRHLAHDPNFRARFQREAHAIAHLEHPHILPVHDVGEDDGIPYLVMRYTDGGTLSDLIASQTLSIERAVVLISQVAEALAYAHQQGVVHRDVKPANVLIGRDGNALLTDFGIAKIVEETLLLTGEGERVGTPAYMAPEQIQGQPVDARSDIYSLGVVLYQALTGEPPFTAETPLAIMLMHLHNPLRPPRQVNPAIPEALAGMILRAMAKNPADRFQTAAEIAKALHDFQTAAEMAKALHDTRAGVSVPSIDQPSRSAPNWRPWFVAVGVILSALALVGLFNIPDRFYAGPVPFAAPDNPNTLNPVLGWHPGGSGANSYELDASSNRLKLIADRNTDQWQRVDTAPLLVYPLAGNFEAQIKLEFNPSEIGQIAGLGVRSAEDTTTWIRIDRTFFGNQHFVGTAAQQAGEVLSSSRGHVAFSDDTVYLKIERRDSLFTLSYSTNGNNWATRKKDYVFTMPNDVEIYLFVRSAQNDGGAVAHFYDLILIR
jgi:serine/threonine protein kinase